MCKTKRNTIARKQDNKRSLGKQNKRNHRSFTISHKLINAPHNTNHFLISNYLENISDAETDEEEYMMLGSMKDDALDEDEKI